MRFSSECIDHGQKGTLYGYGTKRLPKELGRKTVAAHRWAYCEHHGVSLESIDGLDVMHGCDNSRCINGEHLETGTRSQNQKDAHSRGNGYSFFRDGYRPRRYEAQA